MKTSTNLVRVIGVRVRLHYTWYITFGLIVLVVVTQFSGTYPLWQRIVFGLAGSLLFFISVCFRELVLILMYLAAGKGVPIKNVTLFIFGGVSRIAKDTTMPVLELLMAANGLLSSLLIAGVYYWIYVVLTDKVDIVVASLLQWLSFIFFMVVALFQFLPAYPLNGGRVLRALIWKISGDYDRATHIAVWVGRGISLLLIAGGLSLVVATRQLFVGLFLAYMGWVLLRGVAHSRRQIALQESLASVTARDIMSRECPIVSRELSLDQLVRGCVLVTAQRYFVVVDDAKLQGVVTIQDIKKVPKERWATTFLDEVMTKTRKLKTTGPEQPALSLLEWMDNLEIKQMPVLEGDEVLGIVARENLIRLGKTRTELGI